MNRAAFYAALRQRESGLFGTSLSQSQVDGVETILDATMGMIEPQRAYVLATAYHETAHTMQPVRETRAKTDDGAIRILDRAWKSGSLPWVSKPYWRRDKDGKAWFGRGYVQLTHKANYAKAGKKLSVDLVGNPSNALLPHIAVRILVQGMVGGWFTGKRLDDYIGPNDADFIGARRIVNGADRAQMIAGFANAFQQALTAGKVRLVQPVQKPASVDPASQKSGLLAILAAIVAAIISIFGRKSK